MNIAPAVVKLAAAMEKIGPWSIFALLATLALLFAFQGKAIIDQPRVIALLAVPILIQVFFKSALATVVGVLIEVPVMRLVVKVVNASRGWYGVAAAPRG